MSIRDDWGAIGSTTSAEALEQQQAPARIGQQHPFCLIPAAPSGPASTTLGDVDSTIQSAAKAVPIESRGGREGSMGGLKTLRSEPNSSVYSRLG